MPGRDPGDDAPVFAYGHDAAYLQSHAVGEIGNRARPVEHATGRIAQQARREVDHQLVDQARRQQCPVELRPRLHMHLVDAACTECIEHHPQVDPAIAVRQYLRLHMRRPGRPGRDRAENQCFAFGQQARRRRELSVAIDDDLERLARRVDIAHRQARIVLAHRADSRQDCAGARTPAVAIGARGSAGDPLAHAVRERGATVETGRNLQSQPWPPRLHALDPTRVEIARLGFAQPDFDRDTRGVQAVGTARRLWIGVAHRGDHAADACRKQRFRARRRPPMVVAGLQRDVRGGAARIIAALARVGQGAHFRVRFAAALVPALTEHLRAARDDTANARVWSRRVHAALRKLQRARHQFAIDVDDRRHWSTFALTQRPYAAWYWSNARSTRLAARRDGLDFLQCVAEISHVLEAAVHGCKADVRHLVELVELLHHHFADLPRWDLALTEAKDVLYDAFDRLIDILGGHRPLVQRTLETVANPGDVEVGSRAIL